MSRRILIAMFLLIFISSYSPIYSEDFSENVDIQDMKINIDKSVSQLINEFGAIGEGYGVTQNAAIDSSFEGCVEVDIEMPDTVRWSGIFDPGQAQSYFELTNCGNEATQIILEFSIRINFSYLIDTTLILTPFPIFLGAGETVVHECYFPIPFISGNVTVCVNALSGSASSSDCASTAIIGLGDQGIPFESEGILFQRADCVLFAPAGDEQQGFVLTNYGEFGPGDTVLVSGNLQSECETECLGAIGCIYNNSIESTTNTGILFESCGVIIPSQECRLFVPTAGNDSPYNPEDTLYQMILTLDNFGDFEDFDSVYVSGILVMGSDSSCPHASGKVTNNSIDVCNEWPSMPFAGCGVLLQGTECVLFAPEGEATAFILDNYSNFIVGDTVFIDGFMVPDCYSICMQGNGCIVGNSIELCYDTIPDHNFEACGLLIENDHCMLFQPLGYSADSASWYFHLANYDDFNAGDTVVISGNVIYGCELYCGEELIGCITNNSIGSCNDDPSVDSIHYSGCGTVEYLDFCLLFKPLIPVDPSFSYFALDHWTGQQPGDTVYVSGLLMFGADNTCPAAEGRIYDNIITYDGCDVVDSSYYSGCGYLMDDTGCVRFYPFDGSFAPAVLTDYGTFNVFDTVYIEGYLDMDCTDHCAYGFYICLDNSLIESCGGTPAVPYSGCGTVEYLDFCLLFHPLESEDTLYFASYYFALDHWTGQQPGDTVFVEGMLSYGNDTLCPAANGRIYDNVIRVGNCDTDDSTYYVGCGMLYDDSGCMRYYPMGDDFPPAVLADYGNFNMFDTVFVEGFMNVNCTDECSEGYGVCIDNVVIQSCGGNPNMDTTWFTGCGLLVDDTGCVRFYPFESDLPPMELTDYGDFGFWDTVYVEGMIDIECLSNCIYGLTICLDNNIISACDDSPLDTTMYQGCGVLLDTDSCLIFQALTPDSILTFDAMYPMILENYGDYFAGDTVYVYGAMMPLNQQWPCPGAFAILLNNTIENCDGPSSVETIEELNIYNTPNPFNPFTKIVFELPKPSLVSLSVFNILGQRVDELIDNEYMSGQIEVEWNGIAHASGIYFYRLMIDDNAITKKMSLIK